MVKTFTTNNGQTYSLTSNVATDLPTINHLDREYHDKAEQLKKEKKCHIFYNLKKYSTKGYEYSQYFLIPIDAVDAEKIPLIFNGKSCEYYIGISYYHDMPDISYSEKMAIRESYWNNMTGYQYEEKCADDLKSMGFTDVSLTPKSGDYGIDVIAYKDGLKYGIQCKHYQGSVPNKAVQEAYSGAAFYGCDKAIVMTDSYFTPAAKEMADRIGVKLWSSNEKYKEV